MQYLNGVVHQVVPPNRDGEGAGGVAARVVAACLRGVHQLDHLVAKSESYTDMYVCRANYNSLTSDICQVNIISEC